MAQTLPAAAAAPARPGARPVTNVFRMLVLGPMAAICAAVFVILYPLSAHTAYWFAWTTGSGMTAATLGAAFLAAAVLFGTAGLEQRWADVRLAALAPIPLLLMVCVANVLHFDRFHLHTGDSAIGMLVAAIWLVAFAGLPFVLAIGLTAQAVFGRGGPAPRGKPLPAWARNLVEFFGCSMIFIGGVFFCAPTTFASWWPWRVDAFDLRVMCAWCVTFGVAAIVATWEDDLDRVRSGLAAFVVFGLFELVNVLRYVSFIEWSHPSAWIFLLLTFATIGIGIVGLFLAGRPELVEVAQH